MMSSEGVNKILCPVLNRILTPLLLLFFYLNKLHIPHPHPKSKVSCQKGPTRHAYAWQIGPFWQDTLDISLSTWSGKRLICMWVFLHIFISHSVLQSGGYHTCLHAWLFLMLPLPWVFNIWILACISSWDSLPILIQCLILSKDISYFDDKLGMPKNAPCC